MNSEITKEFRQRLRHLPPDARRQAYAAYRLFKNDPYHPSLHFKRVDDNPPMYSVRVGMGYCAWCTQKCRYYRVVLDRDARRLR